MFPIGFHCLQGSGGMGSGGVRIRALRLRSRGGQGQLIRVICGTGTKRVKNSLSYLGILATLCFSVVHI